MIGVIARGACSPLGFGGAATRAAPLGERAQTAVKVDAELTAAGLLRPFVARVALDTAADRATALLDHAFAECARDLDRALPEWRTLRVGAAIGTSSGGMRTFEKTGAGLYIGPLVESARPVALEPVSLVLGACASSTLAIGIGRAWLIEDRCDVVLCGGFDAVSVFVAAGFECLRATCGPHGPQPFRVGRDGLALGEGAALVALARRPARYWIGGFAATCDAKHLTAPDPEGGGLARAIGALEGPFDLVSAHGTATPQNDAAERRALPDVPTIATKGTIGHTLGAAGALELLTLIDAMESEIAPASFGEGPIEGPVLDRTAPCSARRALKVSAAFGGANAALVVQRDEPPRAASPRTSFLSEAVHVVDADADVLAERTKYPRDRIARGDDLVRLALAALAALEDRVGSLAGAGIILGHGLATIETNALFQARIASAGAARAEPRRFPYTTPNAAAGECAVAFGLTGPAFAVGGGPHGGIEALGVASSLVRTGAAERIVVVALDAVGPATALIAPETETGAVAVLVGATPGVARLDSWMVRLEQLSFTPTLSNMAAHPALLPIAKKAKPEELSATLPWGGFAKARLFWL